MKWVPDRTGRFPQRPHYDPVELDSECEDLLSSFLLGRYKAVSYPVRTEDLKILIEQYASDLDQYADLSEEGDDVEGVTDFISGSKPRVRIDKRLSEQTRRENRLRTTLTHELGHVKFHSFLWAAAWQQQSLLPRPKSSESPKCKRDSIINARQADWMEWQAGYASGALLMPVSVVKKLAGTFMSANSLHAPISATSALGLSLLGQAQETFQVSQDAARVRLAKLGIMTDQVTVTASFRL